MRLACLLLLALAATMPLSPYSIVATRAIEAPTIAEIFIEESLIRVEAEVDLQQPDAVAKLNFGTGNGRMVSSSERPRFQRDNVTGEVLPSQNDKRVLAQTWEFPLPGRAKAVTISGPRIGFLAYHLGLPVTDLHYLEGEQVLDLDWQDPWNSRFRNIKLRRQYDARVSAFLYVEPYEIRVEVVARPVDVDAWSAKTIPAEAQPRLKETVASILESSFELAVDGEVVKPELDKVHFLRRRLWNSSVIDPPEVLNGSSATVGAIFVLPSAGYPREASIAWKRFDARIQQVTAAATDDAGPRPAILRPQSNLLRWKNLLNKTTSTVTAEFGRPPGPMTRSLPLFAGICATALIALVLRTVLRMHRGYPLSRYALLASFALLLLSAGAFTAAQSSTISDQQAATVLRGLLLNIYRAFDFRDEGEVYDMLARSVSGDLLRQTYLETRRSLELRNQGGARVRVKQVEIQRAEGTAPSGENGFRTKCVWTVAGSVGHWGHVHQRRNQYQGLFTIQAVDGNWKITAMELLSEERLLPELPGV